MVGLPLGEGKAVIAALVAGDPTALFRAFGKAVAPLDGRYVTVEDVGTNIADVKAVRLETRHVAGLTSQRGKTGGAPSP